MSPMPVLAGISRVGISSRDSAQERELKVQSSAGLSQRQSDTSPAGSKAVASGGSTEKLGKGQPKVLAVDRSAEQDDLAAITVVSSEERKSLGPRQAHRQKSPDNASPLRKIVRRAQRPKALAAQGNRYGGRGSPPPANASPARRSPPPPQAHALPDGLYINSKKLLPAKLPAAEAQTSAALLEKFIQGRKKAPFRTKDQLSPQTSRMLSEIGCDPSGSLSLLTTGFNRLPTGLKNANSIDLARALFQQNSSASQFSLHMTQQDLMTHLAGISQSSQSFLKQANPNLPSGGALPDGSQRYIQILGDTSPRGRKVPLEISISSRIRQHADGMNEAEQPQTAYVNDIPPDDTPDKEQPDSTLRPVKQQSDYSAVASVNSLSPI